VTTEPRLLSDLRGLRYGEVFLVFLRDTPFIEVYNSFPMNDCPDELWRALNVDEIAKEFGADVAVLNGPRYWMMDGIGKIDAIEPVLRTFGGIEMRRVATLEVDGSFARTPYSERHVNRSAVWHFDAGKPVYELVAPNGNVYVLQAYCVGVDPTLEQSSLAGLEQRLALPDGWRFQTRVLDDELIIDTSERVATVLQDEFQNTYTLVG
jgi:hypothetical protein